MILEQEMIKCLLWKRLMNIIRCIAHKHLIWFTCLLWMKNLTAICDGFVNYLERDILVNPIATWNIHQYAFIGKTCFHLLGPSWGEGLVALLFSVEICVRLYRANKRVQDPDLDNLSNPHEVKHWIDPRIIPFGLGLYREEEKFFS